MTEAEDKQRFENRQKSESILIPDGQKIKVQLKEKTQEQRNKESFDRLKNLQ